MTRLAGELERLGAMRLELEKLETFYASPLGRLAAEQISQRISTLWPRADGLDVLGIGYAGPLLSPFTSGARRVVSAMPETQGAAPWPADQPNSAVHVEDERLPFQDAMFDRIIVCHGLEEAESPQRLLREIWRVAAPEARILIIVANRRGMWALRESTPMGQGRPYSRGQMNRLLESSMYQPTASARALYAPPLGLSVITSAGDAWEKIGRWGWGAFSGVLMVEAIKRVYAEPGAPSGLKVKSKVPAAAKFSPPPVDREGPDVT